LWRGSARRSGRPGARFRANGVEIGLESRRTPFGEHRLSGIIDAILCRRGPRLLFGIDAMTRFRQQGTSIRL
jgi:hypothetical protein